MKAADLSPGLLLQATGLGKSFGGIEAVADVSFAIKAGELLALIGPNGAGKSTLFNLLSGQLRADRGSAHLLMNPAASVKVATVELTGKSPQAISRLGVGRTFQVAQTFASLTVLENVQIALLAADGLHFSLLRPAKKHRIPDAMALLANVGLQAQAARICGEMAYGDIKRIELAIALAGKPRLLLMDEPTAGMSSAERQALMALVRQIAKSNNMGVLFTEHSMDVVFASADRILVLARGRLIAEGSAEAVRRNPEVQAVYFGTGRSFETIENKGLVPSAGSNAAAPPLPQPLAAPLLLQVQSLSVWRGSAHTIASVDLQLGRGEAVALLGRNGAGKSTVLEALCGLLPQRQGRINFMGHDLSASLPHTAARLGLGFVPEDRRIFTGLSVRENLEVGRQPPRQWPADYAGGRAGLAAPSWTPESLFALLPNLAALHNRLGGRMSGGEQQMLTLARTLMGNPFALLLDEPSEGIAPLIVEQIASALIRLKAQGVSMLLAEQNIHFAALVADRAYVLDKGRIAYSGSMADLMENAALRQKLLGV